MTVPNPTVPNTTVSTTTVPNTIVPNTTVPNTTVPNTTVSTTTAPNTTVSTTTVPTTTVPNTTVPNTTVSTTTVPDTTVPTAAGPNASAANTAAGNPADRVDQQPQPANRRASAREINAGIRYTGWTVLRRRSEHTGFTDPAAPAAADELVELEKRCASRDVVIRGWYDVSGMRADADLMVWWHAPDAQALQIAGQELRRTSVGRATTVSWAAMGLHRPAEFNKGHIPAFLAGADARRWVAVYPFVRSYEWYLLPDAERRALLVEHGVMGREYNQVLSNTVAAFALGDWEWILALEADELHDIVDLMRHLRSSGARRHVREEVPFFTGRRVEPTGVVEVLR